MSYGSNRRTERTVGLDLGDKYSYLCVLDTETGKLVQDGRLRTIPATTSDAASIRSRG